MRREVPGFEGKGFKTRRKAVKTLVDQYSEDVYFMAKLEEMFEKLDIQSLTTFRTNAEKIESGIIKLFVEQEYDILTGIF